MRSLFHLASELEKFLLEHRWRYCFIGGIASQRWGEPRLTIDVDVTLLAGLGNEEPFVTSLLGRYRGRVPDAGQFALKNRVLLLQSADGIGMDIALGALPFEEEAVARATRFEFLPDISLLTCSAEDLVIMKAFADRGRDWADVEGILVRQRGALDWNYMRRQLEPLCALKEAPEIVTRLTQLDAKIRGAQ